MCCALLVIVFTMYTIVYRKSTSVPPCCRLHALGILRELQWKLYYSGKAGIR